MTTPITKLLILRLGAMGDLLHVSPSFRVLKEKHPELEIHLLTSPAYKALASQFQELHHVWTFEKGKNWLQTIQRLQSLAHQLKETGIDGMLILQPNPRSWLLSRMVLGLSPSENQYAIYRKEKLKVSPKEERQSPRRHAVTDFYQAFRQLFQLPNFDEKQLIPQLTLSKPKQTAPNPDQSLQVGLIPGVGSKRSNRAWPKKNYINLIQGLFHSKVAPFQLNFIGGPDEKPLANALETQLKKELPQLLINNSCGTLSMLETAELASQCKLIIGGDTGPLHLSAAVGAPIVAIYGPTSKKRTGPLGHQAITTLSPPDKLDFWPCETPDCTSHSQDPYACTRPITAEKVLEACLKHLSNI